MPKFARDETVSNKIIEKLDFLMAVRNVLHIAAHYGGGVGAVTKNLVMGLAKSKMPGPARCANKLPRSRPKLLRSKPKPLRSEKN